MLPSKYSGKIEGLCGDYDGNYLNDFSELSEGNLAKTPNEFARLWKTSPLCPDPDLPQDFDPCMVKEFVSWVFTYQIITQENWAFT